MEGSGHSTRLRRSIGHIPITSTIAAKDLLMRIFITEGNCGDITAGGWRLITPAIMVTTRNTTITTTTTTITTDTHQHITTPTIIENTTIPTTSIMMHTVDPHTMDITEATILLTITTDIMLIITTEVRL